MGVDAVTMIAAGEVQLVVNTPSGSGARADGALIRGACVVHAVSCLTTISAGFAAAKGIADTRRTGLAGRARSRSCTDERPLDQRRRGATSFARSLTAAGTSGYGDELAGYGDLRALGAVVVKSLAAFAWEGNPRAARRRRRVSTW